MYANLTSALTMTTDMPANDSRPMSNIQELQRVERELQRNQEAKDANTLEQRLLALEQSALELDEQRDLERKQRDLERKQRDLERKQRAAELDDVRTLLVATLEQNTVLVDMIAQLAGEVLDRPADSVKCQAIAISTGTQCKRTAVSNGYCHVHQD